MRRINPTAPLLRAAEQKLDPEELIGRDLFDLATKTQEVRRWFDEEAADFAPAPHRHEHKHPHGQERHDPNRHDDDIRAFSFVFDDAIDWTAFGLWLSMLLHRHGDSILRVKGLLNIEGEAAPVAVHGLQQLVHAPVHLEAWPSADSRTRIVFICRGLDEAAIRRSFAGFVSKGRPVAA